MGVPQVREVVVVGHLTDLADFSFIIPVLNEEKSIIHFLANLQSLRQQGVKIVLVDGGSADRTVAMATHWVDRIIHSRAGRAAQMNAGASVVTSPYLCFLHADTLLPADVTVQLARFRESGKSWGRFDVRLSGNNPVFQVIAIMMNIRSRLTGIATGDQALFMSRHVFAQVNGFPAIPLMEDVAISKQLKRFGRPFCISSPVQTSSRRWEEKGVWKTILLMWKLRWQYFCGVSPQKIYQEYYGRD